MSAITKIFGSLINVVTAIVGGILGIFKKKKKGEFFLEIDSSKDGAAAEPAQAAAVAAPAQAETASAPKKAASKKAKKSKTAKQSKKSKAPKAAPAPQAAPQAAALASQALNMPKPKVATIEPLDIPKFGPARRPGSNMQSFLDMAKTVKS